MRLFHKRRNRNNLQTTLHQIIEMEKLWVLAVMSRVNKNHFALFTCSKAKKYDQTCFAQSYQKLLIDNAREKPSFNAILYLTI